MDIYYNVKLVIQSNEKEYIRNNIYCMPLTCKNLIFKFVDICNEYVQNKKPWETKDKKVLYELVDCIKAIAILLWPFIPETSKKIAKQIGFKIALNEINKPLKVKKIKKSEILFKKI